MICLGWITIKGRRFYKDDKTGQIKKDKFGNPHNSRYDIVRFYHPSLNRNSRKIMQNVDGDVAHAHVNDPKTRKEGKYFDGFTKIN